MEIGLEFLFEILVLFFWNLIKVRGAWLNVEFTKGILLLKEIKGIRVVIQYKCLVL